MSGQELEAETLETFLHSSAHLPRMGLHAPGVGEVGGWANLHHLTTQEMLCRHVIQAVVLLGPSSQVADPRSVSGRQLKLL